MITDLEKKAKQANAGETVKRDSATFLETMRRNRILFN